MGTLLEYIYKQTSNQMICTGGVVYSFIWTYLTFLSIEVLDVLKITIFYWDLSILKYVDWLLITCFVGTYSTLYNVWHLIYGFKMPGIELSQNVPSLHVVNVIIFYCWTLSVKYPVWRNRKVSHLYLVTITIVNILYLTS